MHPFLQAQNLSYAIIVVEQGEGVGMAKAAFNRAKLFNVGFIEGFKVTYKELPTRCQIFSFVDPLYALLHIQIADIIYGSRIVLFIL